MSTRCVRLVAVISVAAIAMDVAADPAAADRAAADAQTRAANNDFLGAAEKYREAFAESPRPDLLCNVGVAYYKAKDLPRAQRYLEHCFAIGTSLDQAFRENVKKVLVAVEGKLAAESYTPVDLLVQPPTASVAIEGGVPFDEPIVGSRRVWLPFGKYKLVVHAEGHVDRVIEIEAKDHQPVPARVALERASLERSPINERGSGAGAGSGSNAGSGSAVEPLPIIEPQQRSKTPALVVSGASLVTAGMALGFFLAARGSAEAAGTKTVMEDYNREADEARFRQKLSWGFAALGGAGALVSGYLWYRATRTQTRVEVTGSGGGAAVSFSRRW